MTPFFVLEFDLTGDGAADTWLVNAHSDPKLPAGEWVLGKPAPKDLVWDGTQYIPAPGTGGWTLVTISGYTFSMSGYNDITAWAAATYDTGAKTLGNAVVARVKLELGFSVGAGGEVVYVDDITWKGITRYGFIQDAIGAANPGDTLLVHPGTYSQFININKSLTVLSTGGSAVTTIYPDILLPFGAVPGQVVLISASDVTFGGPPASTDHGFTVKITKYIDETNLLPDTGIAVHSQQEGLENVKILNNVVKIDGIDQAYGIFVGGCAGDTIIDGNKVLLGTEPATWINSGTGVTLTNCQNARVTNNQVKVIAADGDAHGIGVDSTDTAKVLNNQIYVLAQGEMVWAEGFYFYQVGRAQAAGNLVNVNANGQSYGGVEGIGVYSFERAEIGGTGNTIIGNASASGNETEGGYAEAYGIYARGGNLLKVADNTVTLAVDANGYAYLKGIDAWVVNDTEVAYNQLNLTGNATASSPVAVAASRPASVAEKHSKPRDSRDAIEQNVLGVTAQGEAGAWGEGYGIWVGPGNGATSVHNNVVGLAVNVDVDVTQEEYAEGWGFAWAEGIEAWGCLTPQIRANQVNVASNLAAGATAQGTESYGYGEADAFGVALYENWSEGAGIPATVAGNRIVAVATGIGTTASEGTVYPESLVMNSIQTKILDTITNLTDEATSQIADTDLESQPEARFAAAQGDIWAVGMGIYAECTPKLQITGNDPVIGSGTVNLTVSAIDQVSPIPPPTPTVNPESAYGSGMAVGFGYGIFLLNCPEARVAGNGQQAGVKGIANANATVDVEEVLLIQETGAGGMATGISFGVLALYGGMPFASDGNMTAYVTVEGNKVAALGGALTNLTSMSEVPEEGAFAGGMNRGLSIGIATLVPMAIINNNAVNATSNSIVDIQASSVGSKDPWVLALSRDAAIGIFTVGDGDQITGNNPVLGNSKSEIDIGAYEAPMLQDAYAGAGSRSFGAGIMTTGYKQTITGNNAKGASDATANVISDSTVPLDAAFAEGLAVSIGSGLVLFGTQGTAVNWNKFDANATLAINATAGATFADTWKVGFKLISNVLVLGSQADVNYNDVGFAVQPAVAPTSFVNVKSFDYGLYYSPSSKVNARYNWWGDPSGHSHPDIPGLGGGQGLGKGLSGIGVQGVADWYYLSHPIADLLTNKVGYYGFDQGVVEGWNTLSAPMALEKSAWGDIAAMGKGGLDWAIAYYYDPNQVQPWVQVTNTYNLQPLHGIYLKMNSSDALMFSTSPNPSAPVRDLTKPQSWYLIGPTPYDENFPFTDAMPVKQALVSLEVTPNGNRGYNQVVSPSIGGQVPWAWVHGMEPKPMVNCKGYWVFMENADTLAGFIFTPLPMKLPIWPPMEVTGP